MREHDLHVALADYLAVALPADAVYYHPANETHGDCLRIITRAEIRMADEIDRGQASGEVARAQDGRPASVQSSDTYPATYDSLGISRQRVAEWREMRDAAAVLAAWGVPLRARLAA